MRASSLAARDGGSEWLNARALPFGDTALGPDSVGDTGDPGCAVSGANTRVCLNQGLYRIFRPGGSRGISPQKRKVAATALLKKANIAQKTLPALLQSKKPWFITALRGSNVVTVRVSLSLVGDDSSSRCGSSWPRQCGAPPEALAVVLRAPLFQFLCPLQCIAYSSNLLRSTGAAWDIGACRIKTKERVTTIA